MGAGALRARLDETSPLDHLDSELQTHQAPWPPALKMTTTTVGPSTETVTLSIVRSRR
jgi:hypothetical protein